MLIDMFAGFAGGIAAVVVGHPLDVVKVKMQLNPNKYSGMFDCLQKTVKEQHFRGLYTGMVSALISYCTENTILFGVYGRCQQEIASLTGCETKDLSWKKNAMVGGVSSLFTSLAVCPTELVKIRMQGYEGQAKNLSIGTTVKDIWKKNNGFKGFYRGLWITMAREFVGSTAFFGTYELTRERLTPIGKRKEDLGPVTTMAAGALSGVAMWLSSYPMDVIKSRVQMSDKAINGRYQAAWSSVGNLRALYSGLWPTLVKTVPVSSVLLLTVEYMKRFSLKPSPPS